MPVTVGIVSVPLLNVQTIPSGPVHFTTVCLIGLFPSVNAYANANVVPTLIVGPVNSSNLVNCGNVPPYNSV